VSAVKADQTARQVYLHPGQIFATADPAVVTTILGSCVAVCLFDPVSRVTGINHYLLAKNPSRGTDNARYGDTAMEELLAAMGKHGAKVDRVVAKMFGGACVLPVMAASKFRSIGDQNVEVAKKFLESHRIEIAANETGGGRGRKLVLDSEGGAWIKEL